MLRQFLAVNDKSPLAHGNRKIAQAAERLTDSGNALEQRLVFEQGYERDRWSVVLIESTFGFGAAKEGRLRLACPLPKLDRLPTNAAPIDS
jgi:hypothetical protein